MVERVNPEPEIRAKNKMDTPAQPRILQRWFPRIATSPLARFLAFVRPHMKLALGACLMGVLKFNLPLAFPLAFKYIIDVLLVKQPKIAGVDALVDRWCLAVANTFGLGITNLDKLAILFGSMTVLMLMAAATTYCAEHWTGIAGNRMILDLRCTMFNHLQGLSHSFFDKNPSGAVASRFITDVELAQNLVSGTLVNVWTDIVALFTIVPILFLLDHRLALIAICGFPFYFGLM